MLETNQDSLPDCWSITKVSDIALVNPKFDKTKLSDDIEVSFVPMTAVEAESGKIDISGSRKFYEVKKGYTPFLEGDILFAKITPCMENGKMAIVPALKNGIGFGSTEFHVLRPLSILGTKLIYFLVSSKLFRTKAEHFMSGAVGQRRVTTPYLSECKIPLPPVTEQNQIVSKIEELFSELDNGIENLKKARAQLKTYRQAVLKYAFEGKLTEQWRAEQIKKGNPPEPAEKLLERIKKERKKHYQQQVEDWKKACEQAEAEGKKKPAEPKKPRDLPPLTEKELAELPELPEEWGWIGLGKVCYGAEYGTSSKSQAEGKVPVLRMGNIQNGRFDWSDLVYTSDSEEIEKYKLNKNDVLFNRTNSPELVGKTAIYKSEKHAIFAGYLIRINYDRKLINGDYLNYFLNSQTAKQHGNKVKSFGVNQSNINATKLLRYPFPFTTLLEQTKIVSEIETRLSVCDKLEQTIDDSLKKSEALRQSILKKAFSGELTKSWRERHPELISGEHSAQKLLERIKAEKTKAETQLKKTRSMRSKKKKVK